MSRLIDWLVRFSGGSVATARMFAACTLIMCICNGGCVWTSSVVTIWAQTVLIQADSEAKAASSIDRWKTNRGVLCDIAKRLNVTEQVCARR